MKAALAIVLALLFAVELSAQLTYDRIRQAVREPGSWLTYHGTYDAQRFSVARRDQPRERAAAAPGLDVPGAGTSSLRDARRWCSTA